MIKFNITTEEIEAARIAVSAADPSETDASHGVVLVVEAGTRQWTAWGTDVLASTMTFPAHGATDGQLLVSRRLVEFGATLAEAGHDLELTFDGEYASIGDGTASLSFGCPSPRPVPDAAEPLSDGAACAGTEARDLFVLFEMGRQLPAGVDLRAVRAPMFEVAIGDEAIVGSVDWTDAGAPATRLQIDAHTDGRAVAAMSPSLATHIVRHTDPREIVVLAIPTDAPWVQFETSTWTARMRVPSLDEGVGDPQDYHQLEIPFVDGIECHGGLRPDPLEGASLHDVRAYAMDPDLEGRLAAAASRMNWDLRVQLQLAQDDDERVVLALLDHVDPYVETCHVVIEGPHVAARRQLAGRNLITPLLERLAEDDDPITAETAQRTLDRRFGIAAELEGTK